MVFSSYFRNYLKNWCKRREGNVPKINFIDRVLNLLGVLQNGYLVIDGWPLVNIYKFFYFLLRF